MGELEFQEGKKKKGLESWDVLDALHERSKTFFYGFIEEYSNIPDGLEKKYVLKLLHIALGYEDVDHGARKVGKKMNDPERYNVDNLPTVLKIGFYRAAPVFFALLGLKISEFLSNSPVETYELFNIIFLYVLFASVLSGLRYRNRVNVHRDFHNAFIGVFRGDNLKSSGISSRLQLPEEVELDVADDQVDPGITGRVISAD